MWLRYVNPLLLTACLLLGGCAGAPSGGNVMPASDRQPATPVKDVEGKHKYVLSLMAGADWHAAAAELELITAARPQLSGPWVNLGIVRTQLGDSSAAEQAFKQALAANADNIEAYNQLGMLHRRSGQHMEAKQIYNEGLARAPNYADLHWNLAILHDRYLSEPVPALAHYERYQQLTKSDDAQLQQWIAQLREQTPAADRAKMTAEAKK